MLEHIPINKVYTSYFANRTPFKQVSIALYTPVGFKGPRLPELAPTKDILQLKNDYHTYLPNYIRHLHDVGYGRIYDELYRHSEGFTEPIVLCCFEKLKQIEYTAAFCHRTMAKEWMNTLYDTSITELGFQEPVQYASTDVMRIYLEEANFKMESAQVARLKEIHTKLLVEKYGPGILSHSGAYTFADGELALKGSVRIVVGAHGPYVEFEESHTCFDLVMPASETWRLNTDRYNVKYLHYTIQGRTGLKIYKQLRTVSYADYKPNLYYIDLYKLVPWIL